MENKVLLLSIIRIDLENSSFWVVMEINSSCDISSKVFIHESEYKSYVEPFLEKCTGYVFRHFSTKESNVHLFDSELYCKYDVNFSCPETAE